MAIYPLKYCMTTDCHQLWSNHASKNAKSDQILIVSITPLQVDIFDTKVSAKLG